MKSRGIVIRTIKYGETSIITDIFTQEKGLATFIAGSVRTAKSRMPQGLFQPTASVEIVSYWKEDPTAMHRLKECKADLVRTRIPFDLQRGSVALFMAEVLKKCLQHGEPNPELFDYISDTLDYLDSTERPIAHVHLHFLAHLGGYLGLQPQIDLDAHFLDLREGATSDTEPMHGHFMRTEEITRLSLLLETELAQAHLLDFSRGQRRSLLHKLLLYYQLHVPGFGELNSLAVLEQVW